MMGCRSHENNGGCGCHSLLVRLPPPGCHPEASEGPGCCTHGMNDRLIIKNQFERSFVPSRFCGETCRVSKKEEQPGPLKALG
jgi:hypothetical protein